VQDVLGRELQESWTLWVELAPPDAAALGVEEGALVVVESERGAVKARVKVFPGLRPGVAAMPLGPGGSPGEVCRRAMTQQAGALVALHDGASATFGEAWVRLRRA
jgi:anaerobic selenocysteine-containing dehydrogenase